MTATNTADAVDREAAWLATSGDGLPALVKTAGGPFDNVQAYIPRIIPSEDRTVYVARRSIRQHRFGGQRTQHKYPFRLVCNWPLQDLSGSAEIDQRAFDVAVDLVLQRILGFGGPGPFDKTHGGRFLSVGEDQGMSVEVDFQDAEHTIPLGYLRCEIMFGADDPEINA